jgi:SAM-dependent methyltransferase
MSRPPSSSHYSYKIYADPDMANDFDASRFGGPIGRLVADAQERVLADFAGDPPAASVLDVGTGTGRAALALAKRGPHVVAVDSSREMLRVARRNADQAGLNVEFLPGDANALEFPDASFDLVTSLRVLMHTPNWRHCLGEMCRVSRHRLIFDYPPLVSASALEAARRRLVRMTGRQTETYYVISTRAVRAVLARHGFGVVRLHRQFVLPIALHKLIGSQQFTETSEALLARMGLLRLLGSPVTILAERCANAPGP